MTIRIVTRKDRERWRAERKDLIASRYPDCRARYGRVSESCDSLLCDKPIIVRISRAGRPSARRRAPDSGSALSTYRLIGARGEILARMTTVACGLHVSEHFLLFFTIEDDVAIRAHATVRLTDEVTALARFR